jgi:hypothetical protein
MAQVYQLMQTLRERGGFKIPSKLVSRSKWRCSSMFLDMTRDLQRSTTHGGGQLRKYLGTSSKSCILSETDDQAAMCSHSPQDQR